MRERFEVHQLQGYTDGKPSWRKVFVPYTLTWDRTAIEGEVARLQSQNPEGKFRVRKMRKPQ